MSNPYIVLARKHRPKHFADVVGQGHIAQTLSNAIAQNRVAHALLFTGPRGVGKTSTARILARALNCEKGPTATPCDECTACLEIASGSSVDVFEIDGASNRGIDEIRELRDAVRYPPSRDRYKVYIIDEVHMLTTQAFNALLKTLEEPPPHVVFVFATTEPHKIPATILSRCQRYDFRRISFEAIEAHLAGIATQEGVQAEAGALRMIARQSEGCMRDAQSQLDQLISFSDGRIDTDLASRVLGVVGRDALFRLAGAVLAKDADGVLSVVDHAYDVGANLVRMASELLAHFRDLTVAAVTKSDSGLTALSPDELTALRAQAEGADPSVLHRLFHILLQATEEMSRSAHPRLLFEMALLRMTAVEPVAPIGDVIARIDALVAGGGLPPGTAPPLPSGSAPPGSTPRGSAASSTTSASAAAVETARAETPVTEPAPPAPAPAAAAPSPSANGHAIPRLEMVPALGPQRTVETTPPPPSDPPLPTVGAHREAWVRLIEALQGSSPAVGGLLRVAELREGVGTTFHVSLSGAQCDILQSPETMGRVLQAAREVLGLEIQLVVDARGRGGDPDEDETYSVDREEQRARELEHARRARVIESDPAVGLIREVFSPTDMRVIPRPVEADGADISWSGP